MGITNMGKTSEEKFCQLTGFTGNGLKGNDARGDAVLWNYQGKDIFVETKKLTLNQVRPNKYIPVVAHDVERDEWYVIPPDDIMKFALGRRGQHVADPLTCLGMGKIRQGKYEKYKIEDEATLRSAVIQAFQQGQNNVELKQFAREHKEE